MLPMLLAYLLHYLAAPKGYAPTWFMQYDQPFYMANARAVFRNGFSPLYGLPSSPFANTPRIYFHSIALLLGTILKLTGLSPGTVYMGFGVVAGLAMFRSALELCFVYIGRPQALSDWLACLVVLWGGGIVFLTSVAQALVPGTHWPGLWHGSFALDPFEGFWFLNLGRNVFFSTEAFYHLIFLACVLCVVRRRYGLAAATMALAAATHPFTGLELLLIVGTWAMVGLLLNRPIAPPLWFLLATIVVLALLLGYYLVALPWLSPEAHQVEKQLAFPWTMPWSTIVVAWGPLMLLAAIQLLRPGDRIQRLRRPELQFALVWFATTFLLANHEWFIPPHQPLHFTRGYVWTPLALLALPLIRDAFRYLLSIDRRALGLAGAAGLLFLATLDNIAWFARCYGGIITDRDVSMRLLTTDDRAVLRRLAKPDMRGRLVLSEDESIGYLVIVYVPLRSWVSHDYNTPFARQRAAELHAFFATGLMVDDWRSRRLVAVLNTATDAAAVQRLEADGFTPAGRYGNDTVLVRDPGRGSGATPTNAQPPDNQ